ncbi:MAG: rane protein [Paenibacillaceae bacterium]|jgi:hypothetical protein|nr:rane protein [Paenibacillaceae bacterium]
MTIFRWFKTAKSALGNPGLDPIRSVAGQPNANPQQPSDLEEAIDAPISMEQRIGWYREQFDRCSDVVYFSFVAGAGTACSVIFIQGIINEETLHRQIIEAAMTIRSGESSEQFVRQLFEGRRLPVSSMDITASLTEGLRRILLGEVLLIVDGDARMILFPIEKFAMRAVSNAENEVVIRGPRDAFVEDISTNLTLLRRRLKSPALKTETYFFGKHTQTKVLITYIDGICMEGLVDEVKHRLSRIRIDGVLGSSYIQEAVADNPFSPFPQTMYTERPDVVAGALLEGRVAIFVDSTPMQIIAPVTFYMMMQSAEDYYQNYISATWIRWIRYLYLLISLLLPSLYVAVTTYHPEMLPANLLITVAGSRDIVPFPAIVEAFLMEISFEAIREATVRMPKQIGQAISVIGALVIGTAAVQAGIVSGAMVIIVSITGIASFIIPHYELGLALRVLRFPIMIMAGVFGLLGIVTGIILTFLHLVSLRSFGTPYLTPTAPLVLADWKDVAVRAPWWRMKARPHLYQTDHEKREHFGKPKLPEEEGSS